MTVEALPGQRRADLRRRLDISGAVMALFAALLCLLIVLPIAWLVVFAFTDRARNVTLANFHTLFTDPAFVEPLLTTLIIATSVSLVCCARRRAHGLDRGAHRHAAARAPSACW